MKKRVITGMRLLALDALFVLPSLVMAQKPVTVTFRGESLANAIKVIGNMSETKINYSLDDAQGYTVTATLKQANVEQALHKVLGGKPFSIKKNGEFYIISKTAPGHGKKSEERSISGHITDENGDPLYGVSIMVEGTSNGTITDIQGVYSLKLKAHDKALVVSYVGMKSRKIALTQKSTYDIVLQEDRNLLSDVVVTGYQTLSKERATGAFGLMKEKEIEKRHVSNISNVLDGMVAGVQGSSDGRGGKQYTIRGIGTMYGNGTPLVVVDGFPITDIANGTSSDLNAFQKINPNDVESITVLKDAAAASIWGARSANGVIVITTKKGKKNEKLNVDVSLQTAISQKYKVSQITNRASSAEQIDYERKSFEHNWINGEFGGSSSELLAPITQSQMLLYQGLRFGTISEDEMNEGLNRLSLLDNAEQIKKYLLKSPINTQVNASVSVGGEKSNTYASMMFQNGVGALYGENTNTYFVNFGNDFTFNKHISMNIGANFQHVNDHQAAFSVSDIANLSPYEMLLDGDGNYLDQVQKYNSYVLSQYPTDLFTYSDLSYNLLREARNTKTTQKSILFRGHIGLDAMIVDGLHFRSKFQYERNSYDYSKRNGAETFFVRDMVDYYTPYDMTTGEVGTSAIPNGAILMTRSGVTTSTLFRNELSYDRTFGERHAITAIIGNEVQNTKTTSQANPYIYGYNEKTESSSPLTASKAMTIEGWEVSLPGTKFTRGWNNNRYVSFFGNAAYTLDEKYSFSLSARSDASNMITSEAKYRWSPFWSIGGLWNMNKENFMKDMKWLNRLALRLTYGKNGNSCPQSSARTTLNMNHSQVDYGTGKEYAEIIDYGNPTLRWEKTATTNIGIDFAMLGNRLSGSFDFYNKQGSDILGNVNVAGANGTTQVVFNNAKIINRGVELSLNGNTDIANTGINVALGLNYSYNYNKVNKLENELTTVMDVLGSSYVEGSPLYPIYAFEYLGMEDGIPYISDGEGGKVALDDYNLMYGTNTKALKYMGTTLSPHTLGINLAVSYRSLSLLAIMNGRFGGKFRMPTFSYAPIDGYSKTHVSAQYGEVVRGDNSLPTLPTTLEDYYGYATWSTYTPYLDSRVASSSYLYMQELTLNYDLPRTALYAIGINSASAFIKGENLGLLWTANDQGYHPEFLPGSIKPTFTVSFGLKVNL